MPDGQNLAFLRPGQATLTQFGPARVTAVLREDVEVVCDGGTWLARLALPQFYRPEIGDTVLLAATTDDAYVIGVLSSTAPVTIQVPGDLLLHAPHGKISLLAQSVALDAAQIGLRAGTLCVAASRLTEHFDEVSRVVRGLFSLQVGDLRAMAQGLLDVAARRVRARAEEDVSIDGKQIHLG